MGMLGVVGGESGEVRDEGGVEHLAICISPAG